LVQNLTSIGYVVKNKQTIEISSSLKVLIFLILSFANYSFITARDRDSSGFEMKHDQLIACDGGAYYLYNVEVLESDSDFNYSFQQYLNTWDGENPMVYKSASYPGKGSVKLLLFPDSFSYSMPCVTNPVTSHYGWRGRRMHRGTDVDLETGDQVRAVMNGVVRFAGYYKGFGYCVLVRHMNGLETLYAHMSKLSVSSGDVVNHGEELGLGGTTGHSTGSHLHFEVHFMGRAINPELIFDFQEGVIKTHYLVIAGSQAKAYNPDSKQEEVENTSQLDESTDAGEEEAVKAPESINKTSAKTKYHTVKKGDTLYSLSKKYDTTVAAICTLNKMSASSTIFLGRKLKIK